MPSRKKNNKKKTGATRNIEKKSSVFKWLLISMLVGGFVAFLMYLDDIPEQGGDLTEVIPQEKSRQQSKQQSKQQSADKSLQNKKDKFQFEFYTELPEREIESYVIEEEEPVKKKVTPAKTASAKTAAVKKRQAADKQSTASRQKSPHTTKAPQKAKTVSAVYKPQPNILYQLQVGAFSDWAKADAMKGRLAFMGVEPNIQVFRANGRKMYRVRIGPSTDAKKMERIKSQLKAQNINTFMQKLKG